MEEKQQIDWERLHKSHELLKRLREQGFKKKSYDLATPLTRRRLRVKGRFMIPA